MEPTIFKPRLKFKPPLKFFKFGHKSTMFILFWGKPMDSFAAGQTPHFLSKFKGYHDLLSAFKVVNTEEFKSIKTL